MGPFLVVTTIALSKEIYDDIKRSIRDKAYNSEKFEVIKKHYREDKHIIEDINSSEIKVGDIIKLRKGRRVPADVI